MTRTLLLLLLCVATAPASAATTWKVWVDPAAKVCSTPGPSYTPTFWVKADIEAAIVEANSRLQKVCGLNIVVTQKRSEATFLLVSRNVDTYKYIYLGPNRFAAGMYDHPTIIINDGWIPPRLSSNGVGYWFPFTDGNRRGLSALILHEIGHHPRIFGVPHDYDLGRVFHNQSPTLAEVQKMRAKFGPPSVSPAPTPTPEPETPAPKVAETKWEYFPKTHKAHWWFTTDQHSTITVRYGGETLHRSIRAAGKHVTVLTFPKPGGGWVALEARNEAGVSEIRHLVPTVEVAPRDSWTNPKDAYDVDGNGKVNPSDCLAIVNLLHRQGNTKVEGETDLFYDVNDDGIVDPKDVMAVVDKLNRG